MSEPLAVHLGEEEIPFVDGEETGQKQQVEAKEERQQQ